MFPWPWKAICAVSWNEAQRLQGIELSLIRQVLNLAPANAINLALGEIGFELPALLKDAAKRIIDSGNAVYTPNAGLPELRQAVADTFAPQLSADNVCICNGAEEAIYLSMLSLVNPGDIVAIPDPDYSAYPAIAGIMGATVVRLPFGDDLQSIDWDKWDTILAQGVKFLMLSNPSNPSGYCFSSRELVNLAELCNRFAITVLVDEIYSLLYYDKPMESFTGRFDHLLRIGGLSKSHCMSGWRIGWVLADTAIIPSIIKAKQYVSTCAPWLSQKLAIAALSPEGMQAVDSIRQRLRQNQSSAMRILRASFVNIVQPSAGPYLMLKIADDALTYARRAAANGVICVPGQAFGTVASPWIRINVGVEEQLLNQGLMRLIDTL